MALTIAIILGGKNEIKSGMHLAPVLGVQFVAPCPRAVHVGLVGVPGR